MSNRAFSYLLTIVVLLMVVLFAQNYLGNFMDTQEDKYVPPSEVEAMIIVSGDKEHPLNVSQTLKILSVINQSIRLDGLPDIKNQKNVFAWDKLIIQLHNQSKIEITPLGFVNLQLLFMAPALNKSGVMREMGPGQLNNLLTEAVKE